MCLGGLVIVMLFRFRKTSTLIYIFFVVISTFPKDPQFSISTTEREREKREITED